ncbi:hypothetical protein BGX29_009528, partial [Mortierella sp. GBA35]
MSFLGISFKVREAGAIRRRAEYSSSVEHARIAGKATSAVVLPIVHPRALKDAPTITDVTTITSTTTTQAHHKPTKPVVLPHRTNGRPSS